MDLDKVRINQGRIIMWQFRLAGTLFVFFIGAAAFLHLGEVLAIIIFMGAALLLPVLWSSYYIFEVDPAQKMIAQYNWIAGIKMNNEESPYTRIERIFINPVKMSQTWYSYSGTARTNKSIEYHAFIKLDSGEKIFMLSHANPEKLQQMLSPVAAKLECDLVVNH